MTGDELPEEPMTRRRDVKYAVAWGVGSAIGYYLGQRLTRWWKIRRFNRRLNGE